MRLFWTPEALADRRAIYDHIETDNPAAALALDELFSEKVSRLVDHPDLGLSGRVKADTAFEANDSGALLRRIGGLCFLYDLHRLPVASTEALHDPSSRRNC